MRRWLPISFVLLLACGPSFYQAPPPLADYPQRLATKNWFDLFKESSPPDPQAATADALDALCDALPDTLKALDPGARLAQIDELLSQNRGGEYSSARANFLHELRELAADSEVFVAADLYLKWRILTESTNVPSPSYERPWNMTEEDFAKLNESYEAFLRDRIAVFDREIAQATAALKPYWLVQKGAFLFSREREELAFAAFGVVIADSPNHPRAEVALLMQARCRLEHFRAMGREMQTKPKAARQEIDPVILDDAERLLGKFITLHPHGRFTPDAHGWLGAVAMEQGKYGLAVKHQLDRLDLQPTREISRTVLRECDFIFENLFDRLTGEGWLDAESTFDAVAVARHPLVARLFVQHCLDPAAAGILARASYDDDSSDRRPIDFFKQRILRSEEFVDDALRALGAEMLKNQDIPDATTLLLLAWSAEQGGEHGQALALNDRIADAKVNDESLYQRGVVLQHLDRHVEAVAAFDRLEKDFPQSVLTADVMQRRALSQFHAGQAGRAAMAFLESSTPEEGDQPGLNPLQYGMQWADTLLQFAPLDQLEGGFTGLTDVDPRAQILKTAIHTRTLATQDFPLETNHAVAEDATAGELAALYQLLHATPARSAKAALHLRIARFWLDHRGTLTMPAGDVLNYANSEPEKQDLLRRTNGLGLGYSREWVNAELDSHDEASHALAHAMEAAASTDTAIAAPALELASQCLFRRAEFSLYQRVRALETDASKLSREIYERLGKFPDSEESKRRVFYQFQPPMGTWMPGDYSPSSSSDTILATIQGIRRKAWSEAPDEDPEGLRKIEATMQQISKLPEETTLPEIRAALKSAKLEGERRRRKLGSAFQLENIGTLTQVDDLIAAASLEGISSAAFFNYASGNQDVLPPAFKSLLDYQNWPEADNTPDGWKKFLDSYPDSPKAEAASLRWIRLTARKFRQPPMIRGFDFPEAPILGGYKRVEIGRPESGGNPADVVAMIDAHEKRFPGGRYRHDLNLLRAGALIDQGDVSAALRLLIEILADPGLGDLHSIAALNFCEIGQQLMEPEKRMAAATAFRSNPEAMKRLKLLIRGDTYLSRLEHLVSWLQE